MAAQSITTDLTTVATAEPGTLASWAALGGGASGLAEETDYFIQGQTSISKQVKQETKGMHADAGAAQTFGAGDHVYIWLYATTPGAGDLRANGGLRLTLGSSGTARSEYYVNGSDYYKYGGWICYPVDPTQTADNIVGAGGGSTPQYFGGIMSNSVTVKGVNFGVDVIRYGTGIDATGGGSPDPDITFADIATVDAAISNAWGICQPTAAGVQLQGELRIGADDTSTNTTFTDVDAVLTKADNNPVDVNQKTSATFSGITIAGSLTTASFTGCLFIGLDPTDTGYFDCGTATNTPTVTLQNSTFLDWGPTTLSSSCTTDGTAWKNCDSLTLNGGTVTNCRFENSSPVLAAGNLANIQTSDFVRGTAGHAIETSVTGSTSLTGNSFSGYGADATSTAALHFTATSGSVTVAVSGGAIPTYLSDGVAVTMTLSTTLTLTGLANNTEVRIYDTGTTTELAGIENTSTGSFTTGITVSAVDIVVFNLNYQAIRLVNVDTSSDRSIPINQIEDRQYENP